MCFSSPKPSKPPPAKRPTDAAAVQFAQLEELKRRSAANAILFNSFSSTSPAPTTSKTLLGQ